MHSNKTWNKPGKSPEKRKSEMTFSDPLKRGVFKPTPAFIKFVEDNMFERKTHISKPKSKYHHGLRILFSECDPYLVFDIAKLAKETFTNHTAAHSRLDKGFFDMAFATAAEADAAAKIPLEIDGRYVPTIRTRYAKDTNLFIGFNDLPDTTNRTALIHFLHEGLQHYGEVLELELSRDPLFFDSSSSKGYAIINPLPNVNEDTSLIPRLAHFNFEGNKSSSFQVLPERSPAICNQCQHIGHTASACPDNLLHLLHKSSMNDTNDNDNMEDIDGDALLDFSDSSSNISASDIDESYEWGEFSYYKKIEPTTKEQRREAHEATKAIMTEAPLKKKPNEPTVVAKSFSVPQPKPTSIISKRTQPCTNPFGEFIEVKTSRPRGRPVGTTKPKPITEKRPVGRPHKAISQSSENENQFSVLTQENNIEDASSGPIYKATTKLLHEPNTQPPNNNMVHSPLEDSMRR